VMVLLLLLSFEIVPGRVEKVCVCKVSDYAEEAPFMGEYDEVNFLRNFQAPI
jgi:hypothetical protein